MTVVALLGISGIAACSGQDSSEGTGSDDPATTPATGVSAISRSGGSTAANSP